jgi:threonine dehydrogenase-like Zn-dependent dehydrogenase
MRAVRFEKGQVRVVDAPAPVAGLDGVEVRVSACGICASDLAMLDSGWDVAGIPGHEISGVLPDGTPVAIEPLAPCGHCEYCSSGDYELCRRGSDIILGVGQDGGMAESLVVPPRALVPLPRGVDASTACVVEPLAVAVHGLRRAGLRADWKVAVIGAGPIGLCAVAGAVATGCEVGLAARHTSQVRAGAELGAKPLGSGEHDLAIDCAGSASSLAQAVDCLRPGGVLLLLSTSWGDLVLPGMTFCAKEVSLVTALMYSGSTAGRDFDVAASLLGQRPEIAAALITHRYPLADAPTAFQTARDCAGGAIKVVLEP